MFEIRIEAFFFSKKKNCKKQNNTDFEEVDDVYIPFPNLGFFD